MTSITLYGIRQCDAVRKAMRWLQAHNIEHHFHDFRRDGVPLTRLQDWDARIGWQAVLNQRSTTWRKLPEADRQDLDCARAMALMQQHPAIIKRPLLDCADTLLLGFDESQYRRHLDR